MARGRTGDSHSLLVDAPAATRLELAVRDLRSAVLQIVLAQVEGRPPDLSHPAILSLIGLPPGTDPERALDHLRRSQAPVRGLVTCPSCGSQVRDVEGITDERCPWCGEALSTDG